MSDDIRTATVEGVTIKAGQTAIITSEAKILDDPPGIGWRVTHVAVVDEKDAPPGCAITEDPGAGETYEPFCKRPDRKCADMANCYANKECQQVGVSEWD